MKSKKFNGGLVSKRSFKKSLPFMETHEETKENELLEQENSTSDLLVDSSDAGVEDPQNEDDERSEEQKKYGLFINEETLQGRMRKRKHFDSDDSYSDYEQQDSSEQRKARERAAEAYKKRMQRNQEKKEKSSYSSSTSQNGALKKVPTELKFHSESSNSTNNSNLSPIFKVRKVDNTVVSLERFELSSQSSTKTDTTNSQSFAFARPKKGNEPSISLKNPSIKVEMDDDYVPSPKSPHANPWADLEFKPSRNRIPRHLLRRYLGCYDNYKYKMNREFLFVDDEDDLHAIKKRAIKSKYLNDDDDEQGKRTRRIKKREDNDEDVDSNQKRYKSKYLGKDNDSDDHYETSTTSKSFSSSRSSRSSLRSKSKFLQMSSDDD